MVERPAQPRADLIPESLPEARVGAVLQDAGLASSPTAVRTMHCMLHADNSTAVYVAHGGHHGSAIKILVHLHFLHLS